MSRHRQYPRYGDDRKLQGDVPSCARRTCTERPVRFVHIQVSWFRGEDEVFAVCDGDLKLAKRDAAAFMKAMLT